MEAGVQEIQIAHLQLSSDEVILQAIQNASLICKFFHFLIQIGQGD